MTEPRVQERALDREHRAITLGLLALVTMFAFEAVAVSLAMPSVARELNGQTLYPIAVVGLLTAAIVGLVIGAIWSDAEVVVDKNLVTSRKPEDLPAFCKAAIQVLA